MGEDELHDLADRLGIVSIGAFALLKEVISDAASSRNKALREAHTKLKDAKPDYREVQAHSGTSYVNGYVHAMNVIAALISGK